MEDEDAGHGENNDASMMTKDKEINDDEPRIWGEKNNDEQRGERGDKRWRGSRATSAS